MPKKLTLKYVKEQFEKEKYKLLITEYINARQRLYYICQNGHKHNILWSSWQQGHRCPYCVGQGKLSIEFIRSEFIKEGYILLTVKYINAHQKLNYICPKGHRYSISWSDWQQGSRCPYCAGVGKPAIKFIRSEFEKESYKLLSVKYKNAYQKLEYICPNKHEHKTSWNSWQQGKRCPYCAGQGKPTIEFIRSEFEKEGYKLLSEGYVNSRQKLECICSNNHIYRVSWSDWNNGRRCSICYREYNHGPNHHNWKGGISFKPYSSEFNSRLKESILERDNYQCQSPDCWGTMPYDLTVHHIDYNKENCDPSNLITLCRSCNGRANKNRKYRNEFYKKIKKKKFLEK